MVHAQGSMKPTTYCVLRILIRFYGLQFLLSPKHHQISYNFGRMRTLKHVIGPKVQT